MSDLQPIQEATVRGRSINGGYPADGRFTLDDVKVAHKLSIAMLADRRVKTGCAPGITKGGNPFFVLAVEDEPGAQEYAQEVVGAVVTQALKIVAESDCEQARRLYALAIDKLLYLADTRLQGAYGFAPMSETLPDVELDSFTRRWLGLVAILRPFLDSKGVEHVPLTAGATGLTGLRLT